MLRLSILPDLTSPRRLWWTLLELGRVSNLPTVWSNCLAAWFLAGGGPLDAFCWLSLGATFLYLGGMYLNDACDASWDAQHRRGRPVPSGRVAVQTVWLLGVCWLGLGLVLATVPGGANLWVAVLLVAGIVVYDLMHKVVTASPLLVAGCRFLLYLLAASAAEDGVTGLVLWSAVALAAYVVGISCLARGESRKGARSRWPIALLFLPVVLALVVNSGETARVGLILSLTLGAWVFASATLVTGSSTPNVSLAVSRLLAGIVLVDLLAVGGESVETVFLFLGCFVLALALQRFVPAT